jgi:hypothetical protein
MSILTVARIEMFVRATYTPACVEYQQWGIDIVRNYFFKTILIM